MSEVDFLLDILEQAYQKRTWHGANLKQSLRGLSLQQALWRPSAGRHNIWEYMLHCAYWKAAVEAQVWGQKFRFARGFENFPSIEQGTEKAWKADVAFLKQCHLDLRSAVESLDASRLEARPTRWQIREYVIGAANHDTYHAGQIRLLRAMQSE